jgi:YidC/Oxa1 family membrane protein insertase
VYPTQAVFLVDLFVSLIYQPFFNILVFLYWVLDLLTRGNAEMGVAVILLTIIIRLILLPLSLMEEKTEGSRRELEHKIHQLAQEYSHDPVAYKEATKQIFRRNKYVVRAGLLSLAVQVSISLMLWRIFATGLTGEDMHLLYSFMPRVLISPDKLVLGSIDLTHTSLLLNLLQSLLIFVVETVGLLTSPYPPRPGEAVRLQLVLPIVSFIIFLNFPAGKKIFVITALVFTLGVQIFKFIRRWFREYAEAQAAKEAAEMAGESTEHPLIVETKP